MAVFFDKKGSGGGWESREGKIKGEWDRVRRNTGAWPNSGTKGHFLRWGPFHSKATDTHYSFPREENLKSIRKQNRERTRLERQLVLLKGRGYSKAPGKIKCRLNGI